MDNESSLSMAGGHDDQLKYIAIVLLSVRARQISRFQREGNEFFFYPTPTIRHATKHQPLATIPPNVFMHAPPYNANPVSLSWSAAIHATLAPPIKFSNPPDRRRRSVLTYTANTARSLSRGCSDGRTCPLPYIETLSDSGSRLSLCDLGSTASWGPRAVAPG